MRSLSPSTTLVCTRTVSPTAKFAESLRNCSDSILSSSYWFIKKLDEWMVVLLDYSAEAHPSIHSSTNPLIHSSQQVGPSFFGSPFGLVGAPRCNFGVVAREQHFRHF